MRRKLLSAFLRSGERAPERPGEVAFACHLDAAEAEPIAEQLQLLGQLRGDEGGVGVRLGEGAAHLQDAGPAGRS